MTQNISLLFRGSITEATVFERLYSTDSGFRPTDQQPLHSGIAIAVAVTGVVISAAQLGIQIWRLYSEAKNAGKPIEVTVVSVTGRQIVVPGDSADTVKRALESAATDDKPLE